MKNQLKFTEEQVLHKDSKAISFEDGVMGVVGEMETYNAEGGRPTLNLIMTLPEGNESRRDGLLESLTVALQKWYAEEYNPDPSDLARRLLRKHPAFVHPLCSISVMDFGLRHWSLSAHSERWSVQYPYEGSRLELEVKNDVAWILGIQIDDRLRGCGLGMQLYYNAETIAKTYGAKRIEMTASGVTIRGEARVDWVVRKLGYTRVSEDSSAVTKQLGENDAKTEESKDNDKQ